MHAGWAIEGAVGTEQKIDALFLSPDSSISMKIEDLCSRYESTILVSGDLHKLLSDKGKSTLRCIDNVVMDESKTAPKVFRFYNKNYRKSTHLTATSVRRLRICLITMRILSWAD